MNKKVSKANKSRTLLWYSITYYHYNLITVSTSDVNQKNGRFTKAQKHKFFYSMKEQKSYYVSGTAIVIENNNNGLRNRKLDFIRYSPHVQLITAPAVRCMCTSYCQPGVKMNSETNKELFCRPI